MANAQPTLTFLGASGTVTGSKFLLTLGDRRVLLDAGMFQGEKQWRLKNWDAFPVPPASISDIVLTHAHMDHSGYIPALVAQGFKGTIWMTQGTRDLVEIVLRDAAHLQEVEAEEANAGGYSKHKPALPLYTTEDVERALPLMRVVPFDQPVDLGDGLTAEWARAGHILGSASVVVRHNGAGVLFSGDLGRHDHPILLPRDSTPPAAPFVVMESTYGDREHPEPEALDHEPMADAIRRTIARGGSVLIPAFAIDRTELVMKMLTSMRKAGRIPEVPVIVNSPMALKALDAYRATDELRPDIHLEDFADLPLLREARTKEESMELTDPAVKLDPSIIISSSGMATGGRVVHHLAAMLPDPKNTVILTGYQGVGTRGRQLLDGEKQIKMFGRYVPVKAEIVQDKEFSVHGDASDLIDWLASIKPAPQTVFLVHGEEGSAKALGERIKAELGLTVVVPRHGEVVRLDPVVGYDVVDAGAPAPAAAAAAEAAAVPVAAAASAAPAVALPATDTREPDGWTRGDGTLAGGVPAGAAPVVPAPAPAAQAPAAAAPVPAGEPRLLYGCLTGPDDRAFCERVSQKLAEGYVLHGGPALTFDGKNVIVAQAVIWPH